jgi:hypothetical protein
MSLLSVGPNSSQASPLKLLSCTCLIGAKSIGLVLIVMPGSRLVVLKSFRLIPFERNLGKHVAEGRQILRSAKTRWCCRAAW